VVTESGVDDGACIGWVGATCAVMATDGMERRAGGATTEAVVGTPPAAWLPLPCDCHVGATTPTPGESMIATVAALNVTASCGAATGARGGGKL